MQRSNYPISLKIALVLLGVVMVLALISIPKGHSAKDDDSILPNVLPDMELPWNKSKDALVETLNKIYQYRGQLTEWELVETHVETIYHMKLKNSDKIGPFSFIFSDERLSGYLAEFPEMQYATLISSANVNYPKDEDGVGHGVVKSTSREFRVYERELKFGHLELFMVWDKDTLRVRLLAKYKHKPKKKKKSEQPVQKEDGKAIVESDMTAKKKDGFMMGDFRTPTRMILRDILTGKTNL